MRNTLLMESIMDLIRSKITIYYWSLNGSSTSLYQSQIQRVLPLLYIMIWKSSIDTIADNTFVWPYQVMTWISYTTCCGVFNLKKFEERGGCSFSLNWWNCWPSPCKISFHNNYYFNNFSLVFAFFPPKIAILFCCCDFGTIETNCGCHWMLEFGKG